MSKAGIYIHIPFCLTKCPYCDFYSMRADDEKKDRYLDALKGEILFHKNISADTIYLGGGTPSVFGKDRLKEIIILAKKIMGECPLFFTLYQNFLFVILSLLLALMV